MFDKEITGASFLTFALILVMALGVAKLFPILGEYMDQWAVDRKNARQNP